MHEPAVPAEGLLGGGPGQTTLPTEGQEELDGRQSPDLTVSEVVWIRMYKYMYPYIYIYIYIYMYVYGQAYLAQTCVEVQLLKLKSVIELVEHRI